MDTAEQPQSTQPSQPTPPVLAPKKSRRTALIVVLAAVGTLVLAGIVAAILFFTMFYTSKLDYKHTYNETNSVIVKYNQAVTSLKALDQEMLNPATTDERIAARHREFKQSYDAYIASMRGLRGERSMRDATIKRLYEKYQQTAEKQVTYIESMYRDITPYKSYVKACGNDFADALNTKEVGRLLEVYDAAVAPCLAAAKQAATSKNPDFAKLGKQTEELQAKQRERIKALVDAYNAKQREATLDAYEKLLDFYRTSGDLIDKTAFNRSITALDPARDLKAFQDALRAKS